MSSSDFDVRFVSNVDPRAIRGRLIRNPNYGGPTVGYKGWHWLPEISKAQKPGFHDALRDSIASVGIRNPVLLWCISGELYLTFGGSRVRAALDLGLEFIPAIINDVSGCFAEYPLVTEDNFVSYFRDPPRDFTFNEDGCDYHYNLERARRDQHDPAGFNWIEGRPDWLLKEFPWVKD